MVWLGYLILAGVALGWGEAWWSRRLRSPTLDDNRRPAVDRPAPGSQRRLAGTALVLAPVAMVALAAFTTLATPMAALVVIALVTTQAVVLWVTGRCSSRSAAG